MDAVRAILDEFDVGERLQHIRRFIWRGGSLQFRIDTRGAGPSLDVAYALTAEWPAAIFERATSLNGGLVLSQHPVLEGRWVRGKHGYELRVGIDVRLPCVMYIRSQTTLSHIPFVGRPAAQVHDALNAELTAYVNAFLAKFQPVSTAAALDENRLRRVGLAQVASEKAATEATTASTSSGELSRPGARRA